VSLQSSFVFDSSGNKIVDHVGRFENLSADFEQICSDLGIDAKLPHKNASKRKKDWRAYYTDETYDLIRRAYDRDIMAFGYAETTPSQQA
jgi:hypothetical protein